MVLLDCVFSLANKKVNCNRSRSLVARGEDLFLLLLTLLSQYNMKVNTLIVIALFLVAANDVLLSHMITFLNDKEDKMLRGSFFDCLVGVVTYVGVHSSTIITPLLLQVCDEGFSCTLDRGGCSMNKKLAF